MNPSGTSKPVMDVSAPRPLQQPVAAPSPDQIAVRPAPLSSEPAPQQQQSPPTPKAKPAAHQQQASTRAGTPVGVITVTVLVMMLLSAAAVIVYATSQTA